MGEISPSTNAEQARRWNGAGGQYWIAHRERHLAEHQHLIPHLFAAANISPGEMVLDVGCGCGATTIAAAHATRPDQFDSGGCAIGLDLSAPMLGVARQLALQAGMSNIGFVQGDAQACPLRPDSCDVIISSFGVMFFDEPTVAFARIASVLRRGGRLAFLCWQHDTHNELFAIPLRAFGAHTQLPGPAVSDLFVDPQQITELLSGTGWENIQIEEVTEPAWIGADVPDIMSYVSGMPVIRNLTVGLGSDTLTEQVLATIAEQ